MSNLYGRWRILQRVTRPDGSEAVHISRPAGRMVGGSHLMGREVRINATIEEVETLLEQDAELNKKYGRAR